MAGLARASLVVALSIALPAAGDGSTATAQGRGFSIPVPRDFSKVSSEQFAPIVRAGGVVLAEDRRLDLPGAFLGTVVVTPMPVPAGFDATSLEVCEQGAEQMSKATGAKVERAQIIDAAFGKTCQMSTVDPGNANRAGLGTIVYRKSFHCMVTCNYDRRDAKAIAACKTVLGGWKASP
jgi:hypothetical protein